MGTAATSLEPARTYSRGPLSISKLAILSIVTFGLYEVFWFYRTWSLYNERADMGLRPFWKTVGLFVPILNLILIYRCFSDELGTLASTARGPEIVDRPGMQLGIFVLFNAIARLSNNYTGFLGDFLLLLSFVSILGLVKPQQAINTYLELMGDDPARGGRYSPVEIIVLVLGVLWWFFYIFARALEETGLISA